MNRKLILAAATAAIVLCVTAVSVNSESKAAPPSKGAPGKCAPAKCAPAKGASTELKDPQTGKVELGAVQCMSFGPKGLLLIGSGSNLVAIDTGDKADSAEKFKTIDDVQAKLAAKFGLKAADIEITAMAANLSSKSAYFALQRQDGKGVIIAVVRPNGTIEEFSTESVSHVTVKLPMPEAAGEAQFNAVGWAEERVICTLQAKNAFTGHVFSVPVPLAADAESLPIDCNSYHVSHGAWETEAPLERIMFMPYDKTTYIVAGLSCTPVVRYDIKDIKKGAQLKGTSPFDLGGGQRPLDLFLYRKKGKDVYMLIAVDNYEETYVLRVNASLLAEQKKVNEKAPTVTDFDMESGSVKVAKAFTSQIKFVSGMEMTQRMCEFRDDKVLALRKVKDKLKLEVIDLP